MIRAILACDDDWGIGKNGTLPWPKNKEDLKWFMDNTLNDVIIMGRRTWEDPDMPRPLPKRTNIVISSQNIPHVTSMTMHYFVNAHDKWNAGDIWIIGGAQLIESTLDLIEEFYLTRIKGNFECDTFLPKDKIEGVFELDSEKDSEDGTAVFQILKRKNNETIS